MPKLTPEQRARGDLMLINLRRAEALGYSMDRPGSGPYGETVREAFPDLFATAEEIACVAISDGLEIDDHPMVGGRAEEGVWIQTWSWVPMPSRKPPRTEQRAAEPNNEEVPRDRR
jgi:hypothetical protein